MDNLAFLKKIQGEVNGAIALSQQSLVITKQIGDVQTKATTLAMMG